ncbi:MAG: peptide deformylase [Phycisphaerales bacterium]|nr:peptide deformylase [Phycisphaerales bacterium]
MNLEGLSIVLHPAEILTSVATPVERVDDDIRALAHAMVELMDQADGVGLAAPQVGVGLRMFVTIDPEDERGAQVWINPELEVIDETSQSGIEGCLSLPGIDVSVARPRGVRIRGLGLDGQMREAESCEHIARVWQHEHDHLDGRLIIDRMSTMDRMRNRRALRALIGRAT